MRSPHRGTLLIGTFLTASLLALFPEPAQTQQENSDSEQTSARDREIPREQDVGARADGVKGDVTQTEQAGEADNKVQSPAEQDVGKNEDRKSDQVTTEVKEEKNRDGEITEPAGGGTKARADVSPRKPKTGKPNKTPQNVAKNPWGKLSQNVQPKFECPWREIPVWNLFCTDIRASTLTFGESVATGIATVAPGGNTSGHGGAAAPLPQARLAPRQVRPEARLAAQQVRLAAQQVRLAAQQVRRQVRLAPRQVRLEPRQVALVIRQPGGAGVRAPPWHRPGRRVFGRRQDSSRASPPTTARPRRVAPRRQRLFISGTCSRWNEAPALKK